MKRTLLLISSLTLVVILLYALMVVIKGYYPMPFRQLYYVWRFDQGASVSGPDNFVDVNFMFHTKGYSVSKEIKSLSSLPHYVNIALKDSANRLPLDYKFQGKLHIQIYRQGKLIYDETTIDAINRYEHETQDRRPSKLYAFDLLKIPFPLKGKAYKNIKVNVTVLEADTELLKYADSVILSILPDLRL
jgi:hypothetical protein